MRFGGWGLGMSEVDAQHEVLLAEARSAIGVANMVVDHALGVVGSAGAPGSDLSLELQLSVMARFLSTAVEAEDAVVVAAVALLRLAGRDTSVEGVGLS